MSSVWINIDLNRYYITLRPIQNGRHFADDLLKYILWMKIFIFRLKFHWNLFLRVKITTFPFRFRKWLGADWATSNYLKQWWLNHRCIYASGGLNELRKLALNLKHHNVSGCIYRVTYHIYMHIISRHTQVHLDQDENGRYSADDMFKCIFLNDV